MNASVNISKVITGSPVFTIDLSSCTVKVRVGSGIDNTSYSKHLTKAEFDILAPILKGVAQSIPSLSSLTDAVYIEIKQ